MLKNVGSNWVLSIFTFAVGMVMGPCVVGALGEQGDGVWQLVMTWTMRILGLLALGVPMASVRYFSEHLAIDDQDTFNRAIGSCLRIYATMAVVALAAGAVLYLPFDWGLEKLVAESKIDPAWLDDAHLAYVLAILFVACSFVAQLPYGIMVAHHDFVLRNTIMMSGLLLKLGLVIGLLAARASVTMLAAAQLGALAFEFTLARWLVLRRYPGTRISLADSDRQQMRRIFSFSIYILLLQLGIKLSFELDPLIVGWFFTGETVSHYARSSGFLIYLIELVVAIGAVVMPLATRLRVQDRTEELERIFLKWSKVAMALTVLVCLFLGVLGPEFVSAWLGKPEYAGPAGQVLPWLMASSLVFLPVRGVALPLLMGLGRPGLPTIAFFIAGLLKIVLSVLLAPLLGIAGVAIGTAVPNLLFGLVVLPFTCGVTGIAVGRYVLYVVPKVVLGSLPILAFLLWAKLGWAVEGRLEVILAGLVTTALFGVVAVLFMFRNDPLISISLPLRKVPRS